MTPVEAAAKALLDDYDSQYQGGRLEDFMDLAARVLEAAAKADSALVGVTMGVKYQVEIQDPEGNWHLADSPVLTAEHASGVRAEVVRVFKATGIKRYKRARIKKITTVTEIVGKAVRI